MNMERLRKIIAYSDAHKADIEDQIKRFYALVGMNGHWEVLNVMQIMRSVFEKQGYLILEMPFADEEIGAFCYKGDALGYVVLNTSLPKGNVHFALCHELYHVLYQKSEFRTKVEFASQHYYEYEEETAANLFAGMLLMPETGFRSMYARFREESEGREMDTILRLMNYYQVPYMAVVVRCYELDLLGSSRESEKLLHAEAQDIRERFMELWLDADVLEATRKDDYERLEEVVTRLGGKYIKDSYLHTQTLEKVLRNMKRIYSEIKGE